MDLNGIYASLNFPSFLPGFAGQRLQQVTNDRDLALASVRAWNDWHHEVWAGSYPGRIIACQLPWLLDPELGAQMIRDNAERGSGRGVRDSPGDSMDQSGPLAV